MAEARTTARGRRLTHLEKVAVTIASYATWRTLRRARRSLAETTGRFVFKQRERPVGPQDPAEGVATLYADHEEFLQEPPLPAQPPSPEDEAEGPDGNPPAQLPRTMQWWAEERQRQSTAPFEAGKVATVRLAFRPGLRPAPPPGFIFVWGAQMKLAGMSEADRTAVLKILAKDLRAGGCEACRWEDVDVVTPVHLVRHPVTGKPRLTHDSRPINVRLTPSTTEMARAEDALLRGSVSAKLDLLSAFRHVAFDEIDRRLMGFTVDGVVFRWRALTFGCSQSPELFAAALARTLRTIHLPGGATAIVYVDDILVVAEDPAALDGAMEHLCRSLTDAGWYIAIDKVYAYAMTKAPFLGLLVDLAAAKLRVTRAKAIRLRDLCATAIRGRNVTLRDLQRVGGLLAFMAKAAPEAALCRHGINAATAEAERLPGRTVGVKGQLADDLAFWVRTAEALPELSHLDTTAGPPIDIATDASGLPTLGFGGLVWSADAPAPDIDAALGEVEAFAANPRNGVAIGGAEAYAGPLPVSIASFSSSALETRTLSNVLARYVAKHGADSLRGRTIRWMSDSAVAVGAVTKWRAKAPGLAAEVHRLLLLARKLGCRIIPHWVSREAGWQPVADALSKLQWVRDSPEWAMTQEDARATCTSATDGAWSEPSVDLFASRGNKVAATYASFWPEAGNAWTDAFARPWNGMPRAWAFPPFSAAAAALRHACRGGVDAVIVVPRSTVVPTRLRECRRVQLPPLRLVDASGHRPPQPLPNPLDAIWVNG